MELKHHGIKGQHWGVRNGPPYPLSRQGITKKDYQTKSKSVSRAKSAAKTKKYVDEIVASMSNIEKELLAIDIHSQEYLTVEEGEHVIYRALKKVDKIPIAFFDMLDDGDMIQIALGTRSGDEYRGKGYATEAAKQAIDWLEEHPEVRQERDLIWGVRTDNEASIKLAKNLGFVEDPTSLNDGWVNYVLKGKR